MGKLGLKRIMGRPLLRGTTRYLDRGDMAADKFWDTFYSKSELAKKLPPA